MEKYPLDLLDISLWDGLTLRQLNELMGNVVTFLPSQFTLGRIKTYELGDQRHSVAMFGWQDTRFALIPGGDIELGYDHTYARLPNGIQDAGWEKESSEEMPNLAELTRRTLSPLRRVTIAPFLLETVAQKDPLASKDFNESDYDKLQAAISAAGFRFPTTDEWEYACAAGTRSLFRWGNDCPVDHLPTDPSDWNLHHMPNAFGLFMPSNPYNMEFTTNPDVMRGGDGGSAIDGGEGTLASWLPLASSWESHAEDYFRYGIFGGYVRRVYSLA